MNVSIPERLEAVRRRVKSLEGFTGDDVTLRHIVEDDLPWLLGAVSYLVTCNTFLVNKNLSLIGDCKHTNLVKAVDGPTMCTDCGKDVD